MATFDPTVPSTPVPNYQNATQGTDRASLQPLASVPNLDTKYVKPAYKEDDSAGALLSGIGKFSDVALRLTDNIIKQNIDDTVTKGVDNIRDSFGVAQAADLSNGIAPAVGAAGQEGTSLGGTDPQANQPLALNRLGNRVEGLTESYKQGNLSNSAYYAKLEAFVRQTKQQFPGYNNEIDQIVSSKVGTTPANALRASLLQDVTQLQNKLQSQQNQWQKYEQSNAQYIYTQWPNYDQLKAEGRAPDQATVQGAVGRLQARDYGWQSKSAALAADKAGNAAIGDKAAELATEKANEVAASLSVSVTNSMGIHSPQDFQQLLTDIQTGKRPPLTADEKSQVSAAFAQLQQQYRLKMGTFFNTPLGQGTSETYSSKINDNSRVQAIIANGETNLSTLKDALINEKYGVLTQQANWNKATDEAAEGALIKQQPIWSKVKAIRERLGDNALTSMVLRTPSLATPMMESLRQIAQSNTFSGQPVAQTYNQIGTQGVNDPALNQAVIRDAQTAVLYPERFQKGDPEKAVQALFGRGNEILINTMRSGRDQVKFFTDMVGPDMSNKIDKMDAASKQTYVNWATDAFTSVYEAQVSNANQDAQAYARNGNLSLKYNPDAQRFEYTGNRLVPALTVQSANRRLEPLNSAIASMQGVFKMKGVDPTQELMYLLPVAGVDPGTPIYRAIQEEATKAKKPE